MNFKRDFWNKKKRVKPAIYLIFLGVVLLAAIFFIDNGTPDYDFTGKVVVEEDIEYDEIYMGYKNPMILDGVTMNYEGYDKEYSLYRKTGNNEVFSADGIFFIVRFKLENLNEKPLLFKKPKMWILTEEGDLYAARDDTEQRAGNGMQNEELINPGESLIRLRIFDVEPSIRKYMIMVEDGDKRYYLELK
jgi:hypothetical protein